MIYLIIVSLIWSLSFGLIKVNISNIDPVLVAFLRLSMSMFVFLPLLKARKCGNIFTLKLALIGAVQFGLMYIVYIWAFQYLKAYQIAAMTIFTPLYVKIIDDSIARKFSMKPFLLVLMAIAGTAVIVWDKMADLELQKGFVLIQLSNISFACGQVLYKRLMRGRDVSDGSVFAIAYAGAVLLTFAVVVIRGSLADIAIITSSQWAALAYLGIIASGLCFFLWNKGARIAEITTVAICNNIKMPLAIIASLFVFGEITNINPQELVRLAIGTLILLASLFANSKFLQKKYNR